MLPIPVVTRRQSTSKLALTRPGGRGKIPLPKFTCQSPIEWVRFWDQFTAAVDENQSLHDVQKLAFLKSFLLGPAAESIQGYKLTEDYYSLVV